MDDFTLQQELEALAGNAYNPDLEDESATEPISATAARWEKLFGLPLDEAVENIVNHRNKLTRTRISDAHWATIRAEQEAQGYDREAYEYELDLQKRKATLPSLLPTDETTGVTHLSYLVEMNGPLSSPEKVRQAAAMEVPPIVVNGESLENGRPVFLCCIDDLAKKALLQWAGEEGKGFEPTILVNPKSLR